MVDKTKASDYYEDTKRKRREKNENWNRIRP